MAAYANYSTKGSDTPKNSAKKHCKRFGQLKSQRSNFESNWQETLDYCVPRKADVTRFRVPGLKRGNELFDSTAEDSVETMAGILHSMLTNPSAPFFALTTGIDELDEDDEVRLWLEQCSKRMHSILKNSNFHTEIHEVYVDLVSIGTACLFMEEDEDQIIRFSARFMGEIYISENRRGEIDTVYRCYSPTYRQASQEFPDNKDLAKMAMEKPDERTEIIHAVYPRIERNRAKKNSTNMPFASDYIWKDKEILLKEGGYRTFPYAVPRWSKATGEDYGRSLGMKMLPEIKMIQVMRQEYISALQKANNPPWIVDDDGVLLPLDTTPDGMNYKRAGAEAPKPMVSGTDFPITANSITESRQQIRSGFFIEQFKLIQGGPQMTAAEVLQRTEESMRLIGPVLGRQDRECLRPIVDRLFDLAWRRNELPAPPAILRNKSVQPKYTSIIANAQRVQEGQNLLRAVQMMREIAPYKPNIWDNLNEDEYARFSLAIHGSPARVINNKGQVKAVRDAKAAFEQAKAQSAQMNEGSETVKNLTPAMALASGGGERNGGSA